MPASDNAVGTNAVTVFVVDDDCLLRELICSRVRVHGFRVIEAATGDQALPVLQAASLDVLVTDISMPGAIDGWVLGERARLMRPEIVVIYVSSGPADAARQVSHSLYLQKPFHPDAVVAAIRHLTSQCTGGGGGDEGNGECEGDPPS